MDILKMRAGFTDQTVFKSLNLFVNSFDGAVGRFCHHGACRVKSAVADWRSMMHPRNCGSLRTLHALL